MKSRGFTLIELAVVLAVIAVLAAILTPIASNYIDQARQARAASETKMISDAIRTYQRDTGYYPVHADMPAARAGTLNADVLVTSAGNKADETASKAANAEWVFTTETDLITNLNLDLGLPKGPALGRLSHNSPYLNLEVDRGDPWNTKYYVTAAQLLRSSTNYGFVVSAGPNLVLDTDPVQISTGTFTVGKDDIVSIIK